MGLAEFYEGLGIATDVLQAISIVAAFLTIFTFSAFREIRTFPIKLIIYLCITIFFSQIFFIISYYAHNTDICLPSAVGMHYFFLSNFCWSFVIALNFYLMIVRRNRQVELLEKWYHLFAWFVPGIIIVIVGYADKYGEIGGRLCWITSQLSIFLSFFLPGLVFVSANCVLFFFIAKEIYDTLSEAPHVHGEAAEKRRQYRVYLAIFISIGASWIFGFLMTVFRTDSIPRLICLLLFTLTTPLQGFFIFISYCLNSKVLRQWASVLSICFPSCVAYMTTAGTGASTSSRVGHERTIPQTTGTGTGNDSKHSAADSHSTA